MTTATLCELSAPTTDWLAAARELGPRFAARAAQADEDDHFVEENYADLKEAGLLAAAVPAELGGGGASHENLCALLRTLAHHCASTALAFSMHTHQVATAAWRWRHQQAPVDALLRRVAAEHIVIATSGGSDWLQGSGSAEPVDGGYRVNARKIFSSGSPAADLLLTSAVLADPQAGSTVLHFGIPLKTQGVSVVPVWRALGMRGTGSHDIVLADVFVPQGAVSLRRAQGKWHPMFHALTMIAIPLIYAVYVGIAEAMRDKAVAMAAKRRGDAHLVGLIGAIENELAAARLALQDMIAAAAGNAPGMATTQRVMTDRALVARSVLALADLALDAAGGGAFYRSAGLERLFRDAQAARYHPLQDGVQRDFAGRLALGLAVD